MPTTVFISSTSRDLLDHRAAVATALLNAGFHPIDMANFVAQPEGAVGACLKEVAEANLFVGIYAWRYGFIPENAEVSITEQGKRNQFGTSLWVSSIGQSGLRP